MMFHKNLTPERWFKFSLMEQLANVGTEIGRTIKWKRERDKEDSDAAFMRALELLDLTIADPKNKQRLREPLRAREMLVDYFMFENIYQSSDEKWEKYFDHFCYAAAIQRAR